MTSTVTNDRGEKYAIDANGFLTDGVLIKVDLSDIIDDDLESFLDRISEDAGFPLLMAQTYEVEGHENNTLILRVRGDVSMCEDDSYDEDEDGESVQDRESYSDDQDRENYTTE